MPKWLHNRWSLSWATLTAAFALHVLDEASHDFLSMYNPSALRMREYLGLPFPPLFSFRGWLTGLCVALAVLAALTPFVKSGRRWAVIASFGYGAIHTANAIGHVTVSVAGQWLAPGVWSSPVLLAAALWLLIETRRAARYQPTGSTP